MTKGVMETARQSPRDVGRCAPADLGRVRVQLRYTRPAGDGAQGRSRTTDTTIFSRLLYH